MYDKLKTWPRKGLRARRLLTLPVQLRLKAGRAAAASTLSRPNSGLSASGSVLHASTSTSHASGLADSLRPQVPGQ